MSEGTSGKRKRVNKAVPLDYTRPIWHRQEGESETAFAQFEAYRDSDPRRVRDHPSGFHNSVRWSWRERCHAWDLHLQEQETERLIRYRVDMNERHRAIARLAMSRAAQWLQGLDEMRISKMKPNEVVKMLEVAANLERNASRGNLPDVTVGVTTNLNQVAHHANTTSEVPADFAAVVAEVHQLHDDINAILLGARR